MSEEIQGEWNAEEGVYYAKGSYDNEVEYYNEIICYTNSSSQYFAVVLENINEQNFDLSQLTTEWQEDIVSNKKDILNLGGYNGDDDLKEEALKFLGKMEVFVADFKNLSNPTHEDLGNFIHRLQDEQAELEDALTLFEDSYFEDEDEDEDEEFEMDYEYTGMQHVEFDENNPLLQPIHGISLEDYAAAALNIANGVAEDDVIKALGVEKPQWEEANAMWIKRMEQDTDFTIAGLYGQYFATAGSHPKFSNVTSSFKTNEENLARLQEDEYYYHELSGAMRAAYEYGMDGSQWLRDEHGLSLGEFQSVAMQWANSPTYPNMISDHQEKMYKKYADIFAEQQGGNVADDIEF